MRTIIQHNSIIAILRNIPLDKTLNYVETVISGGIRTFEVALNSPNALQQIELLKKNFGTTTYVGAGTAITIDKAKGAIEAGADFLLSPSSDQDVLKYCSEKNIRLLPGVFTPSDVSKCLYYGYDLLKLFPAGDLPMGYIKSLKGPLDQTDYVAVGGIKKENVADFIKMGFLGVGVGSNLIPNEYVITNNWVKAEESVRQFVSQAKSVI